MSSAVNLDPGGRRGRGDDRARGAAWPPAHRRARPRLRDHRRLHRPVHRVVDHVAVVPVRRQPPEHRPAERGGRHHRLRGDGRDHRRGLRPLRGCGVLPRRRGLGLARGPRQRADRVPRRGRRRRCCSAGSTALLSTTLGISSFLATLATSLVFSGAGAAITKGFPISVQRHGVRDAGDRRLRRLTWSVIVFAVVAIVLQLMLTRTVFGRRRLRDRRQRRGGAQLRRPR